MILQEPIQAAVWHCLNHYNYRDAIFLSERLYAEVKTDESLFLLATSYYRSGQKDQAYFILKDSYGKCSRCQYLFVVCSYELQKFAEAESAITEGENFTQRTLDDIVRDFGDQAPFALILLGKIAAKTERKDQAIEAWRKALKLNPFLWSCFENLCKIGDKPNPNEVFKIDSTESIYDGHLIGNIETVILNSTPPSQAVEEIMCTPPNLCNPVLISSRKQNVSPDDTPLNSSPLWMSGFKPIPNSKVKSLRVRLAQNNLNQSFGQLLELSPDYTGTPLSSAPQPTLTESNLHKSVVKSARNQNDQLITRNTESAILQNSKPVFSQSSNVPAPKTPPAHLTVQAGQNVRRSSRLFSNNAYSVKENNKSPTRTNKFIPPKSPLRKTKQRNSKNSKSTSELNAENKNNAKTEKEKCETVTSEIHSAIIQNNMVNNVENAIQQAIQLQKQSAESVMTLLRDMGHAYSDLSNFSCDSAIEKLTSLSASQFSTTYIYCIMGMAEFEKGDFANAVRYFEEVHSREPYRLEFMDVYSTALWHLQREVALSALAQDLIGFDKNHPVTWCVNGNCFSLHREHDTAIKFFERAVQVDPNFAYAYTLLGHEYISTEELDKAMCCFRNAVRLDARHYNAWFGIGTVYFKQERYKLAVLHYSKALTINPRNSIVLCHLGLAQHALKETEKALATFNRALTYNPASSLCKFHRGCIYFSLGRLAEALKELEELKQVVPEESSVYYMIGKVHKKLGNIDLALQHFSWATDLDPKGASSQIKEAFDPSVGRGQHSSNNNSVGEGESSDNSASNASGSGQQEASNLGWMPDDFDDVL